MENEYISKEDREELERLWKAETPSTPIDDKSPTPIADVFDRADLLRHSDGSICYETELARRENAIRQLERENAALVKEREEAQAVGAAMFDQIEEMRATQPDITDLTLIEEVREVLENVRGFEVIGERCRKRIDSILGRLNPAKL